MSALRAYDVPAKRPNQRVPTQLPQKPPQLRAIQGGKGTRVAAVRSPLKARASFGFLFLCAAVLVASLVVVLVLNTNVINGSYESARLQTQIRQVDQDIQTKQEMLRRTQASLPTKAAELGLVPAENAEVINITSYVAGVLGEVIGGATARGVN
jgi:hypothetical protein